MAPASGYEPVEQGGYQGAPDQPASAHYVVQGARNPALNGEVRFRYPSVFDQVRIGTRIAELLKADRRTDVNPASVPLRPYLFAQAIATLEYVIESAPKGWYVEKGDRPYLAPGMLTDGDEEEVLRAHKAYQLWRDRFLGTAERRSEPAAAEAVVRSGEADGQARADEPERAHAAAAHAARGAE